MFSRLILISLLFSALYSCRKSGYEYQKIEGTAQGTTYTITLATKGQTILKTDIDSIFSVIDRSMSLWDSTSIISKFNNGASPQEVDEHFRKVLLKSYEIHKQSNGAFDPSVGPLIKSWGFIRKNDLPLPSDRTIDSLKQLIGLEKVLLRENKVEKLNPAVELDFNAIAQGYTADVIADYLENQGIENYLVEVGGEVRSLGKNEENESWKIGIEKPVLNETDERNELQLVLAINDMGLATSGNYRNFIQSDGKFLSHTLNPETGRPVDNRVVSVTVLAPTAMEADAWATVFMVSGKEKSFELAAKHGLEFQMILAGETDFEVTQTKGFKKLIQ